MNLNGSKPGSIHSKINITVHVYVIVKVYVVVKATVCSAQSRHGLSPSDAVVLKGR